MAGVALHPNEAPRLAAAGQLEEALAEIERLAQAHDKVRAVGETGLDHFRTGPEGREAQVESFRRHIDLAKRLDKTLVIHDRDAHDDVLRVVDEEGAPDRWVMHCFSGDAEFARECLDRGAYLSFAGTVTFKNAQPLRDALLVVPPDRLLVETDAPYLTPSPYRGRPNASYLVPHTMRAMAEVRGDDLETLCDQVRPRHRGGLRRLVVRFRPRICRQKWWSLWSCDCWPVDRGRAATHDLGSPTFGVLCFSSSTTSVASVACWPSSSRWWSWPSPGRPSPTPR